jgi:molybdate-binding protein/DNA-binding transcriptional regulator YhcF (GntR family)
MVRTTGSHLYEQIAEALRLQIAQGDLAPGQRLPTVRDMAREWDCTPSTVSRAYAILADEDLVTGHRGGGTRVTDNPLPLENAALHWATLVNRAERFLLEAVGQGYTSAQVWSALSVAMGRWETLQQEVPAVDAVPAGPSLRFAGSHDLSMDLLERQLVEESPPLQLALSFRGSLGGLMALARGEADIAGTHLWDEASNSYNVPFVKRVLPGLSVALVTLVERSLGLILPPGNPQQIESLADLEQQPVRWINRQAGSGTRVWLDAQLRQAGVDIATIDGYDQEKTTHLEVAQAVQSGEATVGLGIYAAAAAYGLDFIPLTEEQYQLAIPAAVWERESCQVLLAALRSEAFLASVEALGGYNTAATGDVSWL